MARALPALPWADLDSRDAGTAARALDVLDSKASAMGAISVRQAAALLDAADRLAQDDHPACRTAWGKALSLLTRWAAQVGRGPGRLQPNDAELLGRASDTLLATLAHQPGDAGVLAAALPLLGWAFPGCSPEQQGRCLERVHAALVHASPALLDAATFASVTGGVQSLLAALQPQPLQQGRLLQGLLSAAAAAAPASWAARAERWCPGASQEGSPPAAAGAIAWRQQQARQEAAAQMADSLAVLHAMGLQLAAAVAAPQAGEQLAAVLEHACRQGGGGSGLQASLAAVAACGFADGLLAGRRRGDPAPRSAARLQQLAEAACGDALAAGAGAAGTPCQAALASASQGALGYAMGRLAAGHGAALPAPLGGAALACMAHALFDQALRLSGAFVHASAPAGGLAAATGVPAGAAAAANAWLLQQQSAGRLYAEAGPLARCLAAAAPGLAADQLEALAERLHASAAALAATGYAGYALVTPAPVLAAVNAAAVRAVLDRALACHVSVLAALWGGVEAAGHQLQQQENLQSLWAADGGGAAPPAGRPGAGAETPSSPAGWAQAQARAAVAAHGLAAMAHLHFCAAGGQQVAGHEALVGALVRALAASPAAAQQLLLVALPCYSQLLQPAPMPASPSSSAASQQAAAPLQAVWEADSVLAARLSFLLPLLPLAWRQLLTQGAGEGELGGDPEAGPGASSAAGGSDAGALHAAASQCMPLVLLLLQHPSPQLSLAAHAAYASLVAASARAATSHDGEAGTVPSAAASSPEPSSSGDGLARSAQAIVAQTAPLALARALGGFPGRGAPIQGLQLLLHQLVAEEGALPPGSAVPLLAQKRLAQRLVQLLPTGSDAAGARDAAAAQPALPPGAGASVVGVEAGGGSRGDADLPAAAQQLWALQQYLLGVCDRRLLPAMLPHLEAVVAAAPSPRQRARLVAALCAGVVAGEDHARKPHLARWLMHSRL